MALLALTVLGLTLLALILLVWPVPVVQTRTPAEQLDALRTVIAVAAGCGAAATLLLAARRQVHQERVAIKTEFDATERRITELYTKAVDQLGSDKAAVRLGGLYSLERLGNDHIQLRQTIVDVLAAYLRMLPADPEDLRELASKSFSIELLMDDEASGEEDDDGELDIEQDLQQADNDGELRKDKSELRQELQVRLTAQRLLTGHLMVANAGSQEAPTAVALRSWGRKDVDLTGAVLFNFSLPGAELGRAVFDHAQFFGYTDFTGSTFTEETSFTNATFSSWTVFNESRFMKSASFSRTHFSSRSSADFLKVQFQREVHFWKSTMEGGVRFIGSTFASFLNFREAMLSGSPAGNLFKEIQVDGDAHFEDCVFAADTTFAGATFRSTLNFQRAIFGRTVSFHDANIADDEGLLDFALINLSPKRVPLLEHLYDANYLPPGWDIAPVGNSAAEEQAESVNFGIFVRS